MLEARLWVAGGTTSLIGDISFLWNIPTGDKWKVYSKYQFTHNVMKHASIYIDACWRPFLWNKLDWRSLTGFRRYAAATTAPRWCCQKNNLFTKKFTKWALNVKVCFFAFSHFNNFFGTHGHIPAIFNFLAALSSSRSVVVCRSVCRSVRHLCEKVIFTVLNGNLNLPTYLPMRQ